MRTLLLAACCAVAVGITPGADMHVMPRERSPVDLLLSPDEMYAVTANQTSNTISLLRLSDGKVLAEESVGAKPTNLAQTADGSTLLVSASFAGDIVAFHRDGETLKQRGKLHLGFEPRGLAVSPDGHKGYVALGSGGVVVEFDVASLKELRRFDVGRWPRELALSPDGTRLAVGVNAEGGIAVVDVIKGQKEYLEDFGGLNMGQMQASKDGKHVYFPWMIYRQLPIVAGNIRNGWVMASRIARVRLDGPARREAISLDTQGRAVADPRGMALNADESRLYCTSSGTHELLLFRLTDMPFQDYGGPGDHIDPVLLQDKDRFDRMELGGRPMNIRMAKSGRLFVANAGLGAVQEVDPVAKKIIRTMPLGPAVEPSLVRRGEAIFHDATFSFDQWYSCHSCHYEGHTNSVTMDTKNDGRFGNYKSVLSLRNTANTGPWFWHGWQKDFTAGIRKSMVDSMVGPEPKEADVKALVAYLETLTPPPNPHREADGSLSTAAKRGEEVFRSEKAGCARCHSGAYFTDGKIHTAGLEEKGDVYKGYNTPSLVGIYDRPRLLHDGRGKSLEDVLTKHHNPDALVGQGELTKDELADLIAYLNSL